MKKNIIFGLFIITFLIMSAINVNADGQVTYYECYSLEHEVIKVGNSMTRKTVRADNNVIFCGEKVSRTSGDLNRIGNCCMKSESTYFAENAEWNCAFYKAEFKRVNSQPRYELIATGNYECTKKTTSCASAPTREVCSASDSCLYNGSSCVDKASSTLDESTPTPKPNSQRDTNSNSDANEQTTEATCTGVLGDIKDDLQQVLNAIRVVGPILVAVLSVFEYLKAVIQKDANALQTANKHLKTRLILMILLFVLPMLINLLLSFIDSEFTTCIE